MKNLSIRYKVLLTTLTPTVIISVLLLWMSSENSRDTADAVAQATKEDLYEATKDDTKSRLEMAFNAIQPFYTQSDNTEEAQQKALEVLRSIHYDDGNYIFVYDFDGNTMAYRPDPSTEGTNRIDLQDPTGKPVLKDLIEIAKSGGGFYEYTWKNPKSEQNEPKVSYTLALDKWGWMMGTGTYLGHINKDAEILQNEIFEHSNKTIMLESIVLAVVLFIDFLIALFLARLIATPIQQIAGLVGQVAEGDLKSRVEVTSSDELGQFGETFNQLLDKIQHVIQDVYKSATQLSSSATVLNESSQNTYQAISQQDKETMAISDSVSLMSESARKIAGDGEIVNVSARDAGEKASEAAEAVQGNLSSVQNLAKEISQAAEAVGAVEKRTGEIQSMLEVIHSVTEQTNLLALNAAIEAARAGEQGRGFAVVADEVRSLAMRSSESAEEIRRIIEGLTTDTNSAVATMNASKERSGENLERTQLVASSLGAIDQAVQSILSKSVDIASATDEQNQVAQEIAKNLSSIQDIAATNANEVKNNKESSAQLDSLGNDLLNNINFFKL